MAAVGVPSDLGEDDVMVYVVAAAGEPIDMVAFMDFCSEPPPVLRRSARRGRDPRAAEETRSEGSSSTSCEPAAYPPRPGTASSRLHRPPMTD